MNVRNLTNWKNPALQPKKIDFLLQIKQFIIVDRTCQTTVWILYLWLFSNKIEKHLHFLFFLEKYFP